MQNFGKGKLNNAQYLTKWRIHDKKSGVCGSLNFFVFAYVGKMNICFTVVGWMVMHLCPLKQWRYGEENEKYAIGSTTVLG